MKTINLFLIVGLVFLYACAAPLPRSASKGNLSEVRYLLDGGENVNSRDDLGWTALHCAVERRNLEMAELLLARGADVNARDNLGRTPLALAAGYGFQELADLLISRGADIRLADNSGCTPLHAAAGRSRRESVELLLARGAEINATDNVGWTPLDAALGSGQKETADFLLSRGAIGHSWRAIEIFHSRRAAELSAGAAMPSAGEGLSARYDSFTEQTTFASTFSLDAPTSGAAYQRYREIITNFSEEPERFYLESKKGWMIAPWNTVSLSTSRELFPSCRLSLTLEAKSFYFFASSPVQVKVGSRVHDAPFVEGASSLGKETVRTQGTFLFNTELTGELPEAATVAIRVNFHGHPPVTWEVPPEVLENWKELLREAESAFKEYGHLLH